MRPARFFAVIFLSAGVLAGGTLLAQQGAFTPGDVEDGRQLFLASCANCHGADGDAVPGIDLGHGRFRRPYSDDDLVEIIRRGIAGTAMPPGNYSNPQAGQLVAFLRSLAIASENASVPGNADRGKALVEGKGQCVTCHRINGNGSRLGPDLSDIGQFRRASELERALLSPGGDVRPANRRVRLVTKEGTTIAGKLLSHDTFTLQMIDSTEQLRTFLKSNLREFAFAEPPPMPSYRDKMTGDELADVIKYLVSLNGVKATTP